MSRDYSLTDLDFFVNGNHDEIRRFRRQAAREKTARLRPDLLRGTGNADE